MLEEAFQPERYFQLLHYFIEHGILEVGGGASATITT